MNPLIPKDSIFVDNSSKFEAYESIGFGSIEVGAPSEALRAASSRLKAPNLSAKTWWNYLTNIAKLSPIPQGLKFGEIPQGVLRLGGTFAIDGDEVIFAHSDALPGDHPSIEGVIAAFL